MFDKFGEMSSCEELNELAENLLKEGDTESILELAKENGIDVGIANAFIEKQAPTFCNPLLAAIGKLEVEAAELEPKEIMADWLEYIRTQVFENDNFGRAVRKKGKSLKGCIGALLKWAFANQQEIDKELLKEAGVTAGRVTLGIPGMLQARKIIKEYYLSE